MQLSWNISFIMWTEGPKLKDVSSISKHNGIEFSPAEVRSSLNYLIIVSFYGLVYFFGQQMNCVPF